ncbi:MAG TPA: long-chain fatty acid--CoA ligase [Longimicrobiales bacterium]|nr:long-chain fatty acid--CoA ligase [Longimicrobiales bacterium]
MAGTTLSYVSNDVPVPTSTLVELFFEGVERHHERVAFQRVTAPGVLDDLSYSDTLLTVKAVVAALRDRGIRKGDRVAILSENRPEWALADYACLCAGVLDVPVYATLTASQVGYLLEDSEARLAFASTPDQAAKLREAASARGLEIEVVAFDPPDEPRASVSSWADLVARGRALAEGWSNEAFREEALSARRDDVATIIYTSGTTGDPKGVMLTHNNLASNVRAARMAFDIGPSDNTVSFLPLSHVLQRMADYLFFWVGCRIGYPRSIDTVVEDMRLIRPTIVVSVPRTFEKIHASVMGARGVKKLLVDWAVRVADRAAERRLAGREPGGLLALQYALADRLVFSKVKAAVGGRLRFFVSGGGPLSPALARFFYSIGMTILEGYGLTETSPVTNVNTLEHMRLGTVGRPIPSTEIRIAEDGEILVRGPQVMKGYYRRPEETARVIDAEGWLATGDIGTIDEDGFLRITDRKKDLIITAGGKNVAPQPIENRLGSHPLVEQVVMVGDRRKYCVLLMVPAFDRLEAWARENGVSWSSREELVRDPRVVRWVEAQVLGSLSDLASFERPKKIALLPHELTVESGLLTPTLKVRRRQIEERFSHLIDSLYEDEPAEVA